MDKRKRYYRRCRPLLVPFLVALIAGAVLYVTMRPAFVKKALMTPRGEVKDIATPSSELVRIEEAKEKFVE